MGLNLLFRVFYPNGNLLFRELPGIIIAYYEQNMLYVRS